MKFHLKTFFFLFFVYFVYNIIDVFVAKWFNVELDILSIIAKILTVFICAIAFTLPLKEYYMDKQAKLKYMLWKAIPFMLAIIIFKILLIIDDVIDSKVIMVTCLTLFSYFIIGYLSIMIKHKISL